MKKLYHLFFIVLLFASLQAQTLLTEDFSANKMAPDGWTIEGKTDNWLIKNTTNAGGTAPECAFWYTPSGNGTFRLVSPKINTENKNLLTLAFKQYFYNWSTNNYKFGVATKSGSSDWKVLWEVITSDKIPKETKNLDITENLNSSDFQFCFFYEGNPDDMYVWNIDDISLESPLNSDAKVETIDITKNVKVATPVTPKATIKNNGMVSASFPVILDIFQGEQKLFSQTIQVDDLASKQTKLLTFDSFTPTESNKLFKVIVCSDLNNDGEKSNDTCVTYFNTNVTAKKIVWESFTNTSCGPCAGANPTHEKVISNNPDNIVPMFLHVSWPSNQDPFYVPASSLLNARTQYYGIQGVPSVVLNGKKSSSTGSEIGLANEINHELSNFSALKMTLSDNLSGNTWNCTVNIEVIGGLEPGDYKLHVGVTESDLSFNAPNGEKHFNWVLRNMYPSETGTALTLTEGATITKNIACNLDASWKKDKLEIFAFIQNDNTKEILQAEKIVSYTDINDEISDLPEVYSLSQNYPNPFNPSTVIKYDLVETSKVKLVIYDILGRKVKTLVDKTQDAGSYKVNFDAKGIASGVYFYKIVAGEFSDIKKMLFIK
ncbi:MAG: Omp28-related outer membrane protein [Rhodothermaceae bacterium]